MWPKLKSHKMSTKDNKYKEYHSTGRIITLTSVVIYKECNRTGIMDNKNKSKNSEVNNE